ncbi:acyl-CoA dehydrogenase family protein [Microcella alkalica]|uniref:acyl-CoA dehydrogenase family protein n=1 Tax=Microcella alkalica TaxID=355930 RepID=UPI00145C9E9B|nr:acyl-CoA dehydrogenase family protein [Microcella alkalica]
MTFPTLASDFLGFEADLADHEREALVALREHAEQSIRPLVNEAWEAATFPHEILPGLHRLPIFGQLWEETRTGEYSALYGGWAALELARIDASIATYVGVQNGLAMGSIGVNGSAEQKAEWLPKLASGEVIGAFGLTEPLSGSDAAQGLRTTATPDGDGWVLNGSKRWIGNATFSDITIIWAKSTEDGQVKGFIVPTSTPGYTATKIERKQSLRIVQNADITLEDVRVDAALKLEKANSFRDTAAVLRLTRADVAWAAVGTAIGAYEAAVAYTTERVQFGKTIAHHQLVQDLLSRSLMNITASIAMCTRVSQMQDAGTQRDEHASMAKAYATTAMRQTVAMCREALGGNGIVLDYDVARFFADAEALYSYEGTREMNSLIVGRAITGVGAFV